ncbi:MAG: hypothetical protein AMXMBFR4_35300 [Candidatus Hydrogenedentota bacterium]
MMPIVLRDSGLRYFFYSNEGSPREPAHVYVKGRGCDAKIWIEPDVSIAESYGFNSSELGDILRIVLDNREFIRKAWHDHFGA